MASEHGVNYAGNNPLQRLILPSILTPEAAMQLAVNTTNELLKTIVYMPNDFIGGGSKDAPHSEGDCYVSKRASGLIVIITLRAS